MQSMNEIYLTATLYISSNWYFIEQKEAIVPSKCMNTALCVLVCNCFVVLRVVAHSCFYGVLYIIALATCNMSDMDNLLVGSHFLALSFE